MAARVMCFIAAGPERAYTSGSMGRTGSRFGRRSFLQGSVALTGVGLLSILRGTGLRSAVNDTRLDACHRGTNDPPSLVRGILPAGL